MAVQNYADLYAHAGHATQIYLYYDENIAIECTECFEVLLDFDNDNLEG